MEANEKSVHCFHRFLYKLRPRKIRNNTSRILIESIMWDKLYDLLVTSIRNDFGIFFFWGSRCLVYYWYLNVEFEFTTGIQYPACASSVPTMSIKSRRRRMNVKMTLCAYWQVSKSSQQRTCPLTTVYEQRQLHISQTC